MLNDNQNVVSVNDFLNKFDTALTKEEQHNVIREVVINEYVPYLVKKVSLIPAINESTVKNEGALPYFDETLFEVNYFVCGLVLYTKLNIEEYLKDYSPFDLYDEFCKRGMKNIISGFISINEQTELENMVFYLKNNWGEMNRGLDNLFYSFYQQITNIDYSELEKVMEQVGLEQKEEINDDMIRFEGDGVK